MDDLQEKLIGSVKTLNVYLHQVYLRLIRYGQSWDKEKWDKT